MNRWASNTAKIASVLGIGAGIAFGARWVRHNTPPAGFTALLAALNADDATFGQYLQDNEFDLADGVIQLYRMRADGTGWQFVKVTKWEQDQSSVTVKSSNGKYANLTIWAPKGKPTSASVWRHINGTTLQEMADSAVQITRTPGISIGVWYRGKETYVSSGVEDLDAKKPFSEKSRLPAWSEHALLETVLARLAQKKVMPWSTTPGTVLRESDFPIYTHGWTIDTYMYRGFNARHGLPPAPYEPEKYGVQEARMRSINASLEKVRSNPKSSWGGGPTVQSPDAKIIVETAERVTKKPMSQLVEEEIFRPLGCPDAGYGLPLATTYEVKVPYNAWEKKGFKFGPDTKPPSFETVKSSLTQKHPVQDHLKNLLSDEDAGMSARDYIAMARHRLQSLKGPTKFLDADQQQRIRSRKALDTRTMWVLGWSKGENGTWAAMSFAADYAVVAWAIPQKDAVIVVTTNSGVQDREFLGGIIWRVAEKIIGFKSD